MLLFLDIDQKAQNSLLDFISLKLVEILQNENGCISKNLFSEELQIFIFSMHKAVQENLLPLKNGADTCVRVIQIYKT